MPTSNTSPPKNPSLIPLRIPTNWIVRWNQFTDVPPLDPVGRENEMFNDSEDILWLQRFIPAGAKKTWRAFNLDLGWYGSIQTGRYRLVLFEEDWDHILKTFASRDQAEIRAKIERWLEILSIHYFDSEDIAALLA
jgi:hypothetical protein